MNTTDTITRAELNDADRELIDSYRNAVTPHLDTMAKVIRNPTFGAGVPAHQQATALTRWWEAMELLADRVTPGDAASTRFVDDQRVQWFRAREATLFACVDYCTRQGILGEPTIPRPENPTTGILGAGHGIIGYTRIGERLACLAPVDIRLHVRTDGTVKLLRPDAPTPTPGIQVHREP